MKVMILAAGRGQRMRPLTDTTPKPLLCVAGKPLIAWHLERLASGGFHDIVINYAHLGEQIVSALGTGAQWGLSITYSAEPPGALETAGGIAKALPLLGNASFLVVNGDIWCDWDLRRALSFSVSHAHLVFVDNPPEHAGGDFCLDGNRVGYAGKPGLDSLTYAGIGIYNPAFFAPVSAGSILKLRPLLDAAIARGDLTGEHHTGQWTDVGTPERLAELDKCLRERP